MSEGVSPRVLVTGFGPFPGAPENPTEALARALAEEPPEAFGTSAFRAIVLPTEYRRSWAMLRRLYAAFEPDVVVHFGLSGAAKAITIERVAQNRADPAKPDAAGFAPRSGLARRLGPEILAATLPVESIVGALSAAGFSAVPSDDAGNYVCNATLYRSLHAAPADRKRLVGFVHVPPEGGGFARTAIREAAGIIVRTAALTGI